MKLLELEYQLLTFEGGEKDDLEKYKGVSAKAASHVLKPVNCLAFTVPFSLCPRIFYLLGRLT